MRGFAPRLENLGAKGDRTAEGRNSHVVMQIVYGAKSFIHTGAVSNVLACIYW